MASLDDLATIQKNGVISINYAAQSNVRAQGNVTSQVITQPTALYAGTGYLCRISVIVAGQAGLIYNADQQLYVNTNNVLCVTPATVGITNLGLVFTRGLYIVPGTGQSLNVTYYAGPVG